MYKKTILSLAIASTLTLTGCLDSDGDNTDNEGASNAQVTSGLKVETGLDGNPIVISIPNPTERNLTGVYPRFDALKLLVPIPNDLIYQTGDDDSTNDIEQADGTFLTDIQGDLDTEAPNLISAQLGKLSGASTTAPIDIQINEAFDVSSLDGSPLVTSGPLAGQPNPTQNVFFIELDYASDDPLKGLANGEEPTIPFLVTLGAAAGGDAGAAAEIGALLTDPDYTVSGVTTALDGGQFIRINPLKPLKPNTRYLVVVTNEVLDTDGLGLIRDPSLTGYGAIANTDTGLVSGALAPVRGAIEGWHTLATNYFSLATNAVRTNDAVGLPALTADNIAMSYSFTTSADQNVLGYIAEPNTFFEKTIRGSVVDATVKASIAAGVNGFDNLNTAITASLDGFSATTTFGDTSPLAGCDAFPTGDLRLDCVGDSLAGNFAALLPTPSALPSTFDPANAVDVNQVSALMSSLGIPNGTVSLNEGTLTGLPYYLGVPESAADGSNLVDSDASFKPNVTLARTAVAAGLPFPQGIGLTAEERAASSNSRETLASDVVNHIFPFPAQTTTQNVPVLAIYPTGATFDAGTIKTVIYQHGIQADRSTAIAMGASIVAAGVAAGQDIAIIAIDQPLHGIDSVSTTQRANLATTLLAAGSIIDVSDGIDAAEQATIDAVVADQFDVAALQTIQAAGCPLGLSSPPTAGEITTATTTVLAGTCGAAAATSLVSAQVLDRTVRNAASTFPGLGEGSVNERHFGFAGVNLAPVPMNFDPDNAVGTGNEDDATRGNEGTGALFANLTNFLATRDNLRQGTLDLISLRLSLAGMDLDNSGSGTSDLDTNNVFFMGHSLGTINGLPFVDVVNNTETTADDLTAVIALTPGGGFARLAENSQFFSPVVIGGLAAAGLPQGTSFFEIFLNTYQAAVDSGDAINFVERIAEDDTDLLISLVTNDNAIPNDPFASPLGAAQPAGLAGGDVIARLTGATALTSADAGSSPALNHSVTTYTGDSTGATGGVHVTPVFPSTGGAGEIAMFGELVSQAASVIISNGATVTVTNTGNPITP